MVKPAVAQMSVYLAIAAVIPALPRRDRVPRARPRLNVPQTAAMLVCVNAHHAYSIPPHVPGVAHRPLPAFRPVIHMLGTAA